MWAKKAGKANSFFRNNQANNIINQEFTKGKILIKTRKNVITKKIKIKSEIFSSQGKKQKNTFSYFYKKIPSTTYLRYELKFIFSVIDVCHKNKFPKVGVKSSFFELF